MTSIITKLRFTVDYLLDFILDESEIMKLSRKISRLDFIKYLKNNFGKDLKKNLKGFHHVLNYKHEEVKDLIWQIKFNDNYPVAEIFGLMLAKKIEEVLEKYKYHKKVSSENQKYLLIPIPIHRRRKRERGYNQCEWLCENIIKNWKNPNIKIDYKKDILIRDVYKQKQSWQSNKNQRAESTKGIYKIKDKQKVSKRKIILVDDVYTTGSTVEEASLLLKSVGAKEVFKITISH